MAGTPGSGGASSGGVSSGGAGNGAGGVSSGGASTAGAPSAGAPSGGASSGGASSGGASSGGAAGLNSAGGVTSSGGGGQSGTTAAAGMSAGGSAGASTTNLVTNGTFDNGTYAPWWGYANNTTDFPADQTLAVMNGQLCSTSTMGGGQHAWDIIIGLSGVVLQPNQYYHLSFSVSADAPRTIKFKTGFGSTPYTDYFVEPVQVTTTPQTVNYTYLNVRNDPMAQFQFQIGNETGVSGNGAGPAGGGTGTVCVDNIVIEPVATPATPSYTTSAPSHHPFKDYKAIVKMGTAVDTPIFLSNPLHNAIVAGEFSMITPANSMKMNLIQPTQGTFDYTDTDALVAWAQQNGLEFHGHPLIWHTQAPSWLTATTFTRDQMIDIMNKQIDGLMGHYAGKFPYWDVVNEAVDQNNGTWGFRSTVWHDTIGDDFIDLAFNHARATDPQAKLLYNDYNIEQKGNPKADYVYNMVASMKMRSIPIDAIGFQGHYFIEPDGTTVNGVPDMQAIRDNMARYNDIGVEVHITECDFRIGLPVDNMKSGVQNQFYADMLQACIDAPNCSHFTVWGLSDLDSWVPGTFPDYGSAHLFDTNLMAKADYTAMSNVFAKYNTDGTLLGMAGAAGAAGAPSGSNSGSRAPAKKSSGGCSLAPQTSDPAPSLLALCAMFGVLVSRRRSKAARS
jgi:endo-1,4-beta-xylanase